MRIHIHLVPSLDQYTYYYDRLIVCGVTTADKHDYNDRTRLIEPEAGRFATGTLVFVMESDAHIYYGWPDHQCHNDLGALTHGLMRT